MCQEDPLPKILIVDDEENILTMFQRSLRKEYEVLGATSPTEATELLESQKVDAIVVDFELPEISGKEFIKIIRKNRKFDYSFDTNIGKISFSDEKNGYGNSLIYVRMNKQPMFSVNVYNENAACFSGVLDLIGNSKDNLTSNRDGLQGLGNYRRRDKSG